MTFYEHYGMTFNPFHKSNVASENCFRSRDFMNMEKRIEALAETGGLGVFSAKSGMGKTFTARFCARTLDPAVYVTKYFDQPGASRMQFMKKVARLLGLDDTGGSTKLFDRIQESLMRFHSEQKKMLILVIDDAQDLQESVLLSLKALMNFDYDSQDCFSLVLCGEPVLNSIINRFEYTSLRERVTVHYTFQGLSEQEVGSYILHKIKMAGGSESIIQKTALEKAASLSNIPRTIDSIMTKALMMGVEDGKKVIDSDLVMAGSNSLIIA